MLGALQFSTMNKLSPVIYIPHGGGPLPLLGDDGHQKLVAFLRGVVKTITKPSAILVISAHWEEGKATITNGAIPPLIYDYYGFADEAYQVEYPADGSPQLAETIFRLLKEAGIDAKLDDQRGFDHGLFVPLKVMYPSASIPCVQLSLTRDLNSEHHIKIGEALSELRVQDVLVIGSGLSFHNIAAFMSEKSGVSDTNNEVFQQWLIETCANETLTESERRKRLTEWSNVPFARYCHPREEHLLPLHVCYGVAGSGAKLVFYDKVMGKKACAFLW